MVRYADVWIAYMESDYADDVPALGATSNETRLQAQVEAAASTAAVSSRGDRDGKGGIPGPGNVVALLDRTAGLGPAAAALERRLFSPVFWSVKRSARRNGGAETGWGGRPLTQEIGLLPHDP